MSMNSIGSKKSYRESVSNQDQIDLTAERESHQQEVDRERQESRIRSINNLEALSKSKVKLLDDLNTPVRFSKCPDHPQEDLEFYSFTNEKLLCTECLVMGRYAGHEVVNFKKANERIKGTLTDLLSSLKSRSDNYDQWLQSLTKNKEELQNLTIRYQKYIQEGIEDLHQQLRIREKELLVEVEQIRKDKQWELDSLEGEIKKHKNEVQKIGQTIGENLSSQGNTTLCAYYSKKHTLIKEFLKDEEGFRLLNGNFFSEGIKLAEQFNLSRFSESLRILKDGVANLRGLENIKLQNPSYKGDLLSQRVFTLQNEDSTIKRVPSHSVRDSATHSYHPKPTVREESYTLQTQPEFSAEPTREIEMPVSTLSTVRSVENKIVPTKFIKDSFFERYYDRIHNIRRSRNYENLVAVQKNISPTRFETERKQHANKKSTGPSATIAEAYERLMSSRREATLPEQQSPPNEGPGIQAKTSIPFSYLAKSPVQKASMFQSPVTSPFQNIDPRELASRRLAQNTIQQTNNTLPDSKSPERARSPNSFIARLENFKKERQDLFNF